MRQSLYLVAALLAFASASPRAALAFDMQTLGATNADGSVRYADPYQMNEPKVEAEAPQAPNGVMLGSGLYLSGESRNGSASSANMPAMGWTNPKPGRLTH